MFPSRYFPVDYFPRRYFPAIGGDAAPSFALGSVTTENGVARWIGGSQTASTIAGSAAEVTPQGGSAAIVMPFGGSVS